MHLREAHHVTHRRGYRSATAAVAAPPTTTLLPIAAIGSKCGSKWKSVVVTEDVLIVTGGFNTRPEVAKSLLYTTDTTHSYVELDKNSAWFLKGVGGPKTSKGDLKAVQVLQEIREKFVAATSGDSVTAVAELKDEAEGSDDADDPMNALDTILETVAPKAKNKAKKPLNSTPTRAMVQELVMPKRPTCTARDQDATITISVYKRGSQVRSGKHNLYLRSDFIEWLLSYAADELHFQGIQCDIPEPECTKEANTPAVAADD